MLVLAVAFQLAAVTPPRLEAVRERLASADTAAAIALMIPLVPPAASTITPEGLAALELLRWLGHSRTQTSAASTWALAAASSVNVFPDSGVEWSPALLAWWAIKSIEAGRSVVLPAVPGVRDRLWQSRLREIADTIRTDPLLAGGLRWIAAVGWLVPLHDFAKDVPDLSDLPAECRRGCMLWRSPPPSLTMTARLQEAQEKVVRQVQEHMVAVDPTLALLLRGAGRATLDSLWVSLNELRRSPWPFDELAERLRVTTCVLLQLDEREFDCAPETQRLGGLVGAQLRAVRQEFTGHRGLAWRVMEATPEYFASLDSTLDLLLADSTVVYATGWTGETSTRVARRVPVSAGPLPPGFWRRAWPLYLVSYNERLVAHRARVLLADMARRFAPGPDPGWLFWAYGDPATLVRIGVPLAIARPPGAQSRQTPLVTYVPRGLHETIVRAKPGAEHVSLDLALAARDTINPNTISGFVAEDYDAFRPMDHQVVQYVRDGHRQVDVYTAWLRPSSCQRPNPLMGFFLLDGNLQELSKVVEPDPANHARKKFHLVLAPGSYVYSLELLDRSCRAAERARYVLTVPPAEGAWLSDLMLADELHAGVDERVMVRVQGDAPATVRPSLHLSAGETARFYWELYGLTAAVTEPNRLTVRFEVVNVRQERVFVHELGQVARDARRGRGTLDVQYKLSVPAGTEPLGLGLAVGLPEGTRGVHVARVRITDTKTKRAATAERAFFVRG